MALTALSPTVNRDEAQRVAKCVYVTSARLKQEYQIGGSAHWQNLLIALGARKKGYCFHWTEDILAALKPLRLQTIDVHWAITDRGKDTESNALVFTAKGEPLLTGIVVDSWRHAGNPFWKPARADHYAWQEDTGAYARRRLAAYAAR